MPAHLFKMQFSSALFGPLFEVFDFTLFNNPHAPARLVFSPCTRRRTTLVQMPRRFFARFRWSPENPFKRFAFFAPLPRAASQPFAPCSLCWAACRPRKKYGSKCICWSRRKLQKAITVSRSGNDGCGKRSANVQYQLWTVPTRPFGPSHDNVQTSEVDVQWPAYRFGERTVCGTQEMHVRPAGTVKQQR